MRENRFIEQNKAKWEACENLLQAKRPDPDRLSRNFMEVNDDLAFARTFFPNRQIRVYLNQLALQLYSRFQDHESKQKRPFRQFWLETLPLTVYQSRKALWVSSSLRLESGCFLTARIPHLRVLFWAMLT